ncbi:fad NAD binding oxidoreductase [Cenococcum geophilum 1.58]|uniref:fad NAD binding oxidoreductase n=1 Tax=Cenococcum geophilum 1.58 TaxID=794803 RepID=UPI00358E1C24|nr:fad NAD binding oxidoreductase [Cenococcum geophilum 1.58]
MTSRGREMSAQAEKRNIVIIGGGIIGSTTAYFLSHHPKFNPATHAITLLEATRIAGGASGKAGGLLALWAYPSCIVPLSYRLHKELADKHGGAERWGYRAVHCGQLEARGRAPTSGSAKKEGEAVSLQKRTQEAIGLLRAAGVPKDLDWVVAEGVRAYEEMGDPSTTAQVHPYQFTTSMAALAEEEGVKIVLGSATSINHSSGAAESVSYTSHDGEAHTLNTDTVILTAGPWTRTIYPSAPISALRAHSVTIRPSRPVSAYTLFTSITLSQTEGKSKRGSARTVTPEIYARPNNEVYACGEGDTLIPLPASTALVQVDEARCQDIVDQVSAVSDELRDGEVTARQACYLPNVSRGGGPMIGETGVKGLLIGAGHTCWGIQNAPATGKCLAEIVWEGAAKSADLRTLDPRKFM